LRALWTLWSVEVRVLSGALGKSRKCHRAGRRPDRLRQGPPALRQGPAGRHRAGNRTGPPRHTGRYRRVDRRPDHRVGRLGDRPTSRGVRRHPPLTRTDQTALSCNRFPSSAGTDPVTPFRQGGCQHVNRRTKAQPGMHPARGSNRPDDRCRAKAGTRTTGAAGRQAGRSLILPEGHTGECCGHGRAPPDRLLCAGARHRTVV
jgi:hypothetical protein